MSRDFVSNEEIIQEARRRLDQGAWDYLVGGSESETTLRRNRLAFDKVAFRPRILVDVSNVDPSTTFLGQKLRIPAILAPIGSLQIFDPEGAVASTKAATEFGIMHAVSSVTEPTLEETAAATADAEDLPALRARRHEVGRGHHRAGQAGRLRGAGADRGRGPLQPPRAPDGDPLPAADQRRVPPDRTYQAALTWDTMDVIREMAGLPFMVKGIQTAEDAEIAVAARRGRALGLEPRRPPDRPRAGQPGHAAGGRAGGRKGKARIIVDGGVQRGSDILKAVALGADAVALGRLQGWGLAAGGQAGVVRMLEILEDELISDDGAGRPDQHRAR